MDIAWKVDKVTVSKNHGRRCWKAVRGLRWRMFLCSLESEFMSLHTFGRGHAQLNYTQAALSQVYQLSRLSHVVLTPSSPLTAFPHPIGITASPRHFHVAHVLT